MAIERKPWVRVAGAMGVSAGWVRGLRGVRVLVVDWKLVVVVVGVRVRAEVAFHWTERLIVGPALSASVTVRGQESWVSAATWRVGLAGVMVWTWVMTVKETEMEPIVLVAARV